MKMNKQEVIELFNPYLPYYVKAEVKIKGKKQIISVMYYHVWEYLRKDIEVKLLLRPVSSLIEHCLEDGKIPMEEMAITALKCFPIENITVNSFYIDASIVSCKINHSGGYYTLTYHKVEQRFSIFDEFFNELYVNQLYFFKYLYKNHFDVDNLIYKGYAVDVNELKDSI